MSSREPQEWVRRFNAGLAECKSLGFCTFDGLLGHTVKEAISEIAMLKSELETPEHFSESEVIRALTARAKAAEADWQAAESSCATLEGQIRLHLGDWRTKAEELMRSQRSADLVFADALFTVTDTLSALLRSRETPQDQEQKDVTRVDGPR